MFRSFSVLALGVITFAGTPVDAQIFRRSARRQPAPQIRTNQPTRTATAQRTRTAQPTPKQSQLSPRQQRKTRRSGVNQVAANQARANSQSTKSKANVAVQPKPQRYTLYYNYSTGQPFLRPIQSTAQNRSPVPGYNGAVSSSATPTQQPARVDDSRSRPNTSAGPMQQVYPPPANSLTLNAPQSFGQPTIYSGKSATGEKNSNATSSASPGTFTNLSKPNPDTRIIELPKLQASSGKQPPEKSAKETFSVLKTDK